MVDRLNAIKGVKCTQPTGAFYCFPDVSAYFGKTKGGIELKGSLDFARASSNRPTLPSSRACLSAAIKMSASVSQPRCRISQKVSTESRSG